MDRYKIRQLCLLGSVLFIILVIAICCSSRPEKKNEKTAESTTEQTSETTPETTPAAISDTEKITFTAHDKIKYLDVDFEPMDVAVINRDFLSDMIIVGDSISMGYSVYGRLAADNVIATGSIGHRNLMETDFTFGSSTLKLTDIIKTKRPKYIFLSCGMNDIRMMNEEEYTKKCLENADIIFDACSGCKIILTAITPIASFSNFTDNETIDRYNEALRKAVFDSRKEDLFFLNASRYLKGPDNNLITEFQSGDGIHLSGDAYDYMLSYMITMLEWI